MTYELRLALRSIWHSKLFALTALIAFSFGIGATTTVFSVIDAVLLRPATFPDSDSVVVVQSSVEHEDWDNVPPVAFDHLASHTGIFSDVAGSRL